MSIYAPGSTVEVLADIFPARIVPLPPGAPAGVKLRAVVTERALSIAWQIGTAGSVSVLDIPLEPEQVSTVTFRGGQVGSYLLLKGKGCSCRGASPKVQRWRPFPLVTLKARRTRTPGVPGTAPVRYTRVM
jgi:hypothetical protein